MIMMDDDSEYSTQRNTLMCFFRPFEYLENIAGELMKKWKKAESARNAATIRLILRLNKLIASVNLQVPGASVRYVAVTGSDASLDSKTMPINESRCSAPAMMFNLRSQAISKSIVCSLVRCL